LISLLVAALLGQPIASASTHAPATRTELPQDDRIRQWIAQLEDLSNGWVFLRTVDDSRSPKLRFSPAHKLADLGFTAVPRLIETLRDTRPTHAYEMNGSSGWSSNRIRVQDVALRILSRISGQSFGGHVGDDPAKTINLVSNWWLRVRPLGEVASLEEIVRSDSPESAYAAARLRRLAPESVVPAVRSHFVHFALNDETGPGLLTTIGTFDEPDARDILLAAFQSCSSSRLRIAAAGGLVKSDPDAVLDTMIAQIKAAGPFDSLQVLDIARILYGSGRARGVRALDDCIGRLSADQRTIIVATASQFFSPSSGDAFPQSDFQSAVTTLLKSELSDKGRASWYEPILGIPKLPPRICDLAKLELDRLNPQK